MRISKLSLETFILITGTIPLLLPALLNGYPIVYSDTSTYIASGFGFETPVDRPITYGLFLWFTSLGGISLWLTITAQSFILSWLVYEITGLFAPGLRKRATAFLISMLVISLFSTASWTASQLMPDIFTPIMALTSVVILLGSKSKSGQAFLYFIFLLAVSMHMSHVTIGIVMMMVLLFFRQINLLQLKNLLNPIPLIIMLLISVAAIGTMGSALAKSRHVFFMGAMVEHGIAQKYLDEHCGERQWRLCEYKDELPDKAWQFVWEEDSPLYKLGGWEDSKTEFNEIIAGTLTEPGYIFMHIRESLKATVDQLFRFGMGDGNGVFLQGTTMYERIGTYFPHELGQYSNSLQNHGKPGFLAPWNRIVAIFTAISLVLLIFFSIRPHEPRPEIMITRLLLILSIIINAWACGTFANAIDRLGARMIWLVPMLAVIRLSYYFLNRTTTEHQRKKIMNIQC